MSKDDALRDLIERVEPLRAGRIAIHYEDGGEKLSVYWDEDRDWSKGYLVIRQFGSDDAETRIAIEDVEWLSATLLRARAHMGTGG